MMKPKGAFFHEDNYCQIEILPTQNILIKHNEIDLTKNALLGNITEQGFSNINSRSQVVYSLNNLKIKINYFEDILKENSCIYFDKVYTGYSTQRLLKKKVHGFGFENYILYYEYNSRFIEKIWIDYNIISDTLNGYPIKLQNILFKLGELFDLILIDWNELVTIVLRNKQMLVRYIQEVL